jgi:predicted HTH transcriptional regulator
MTIEEIMSGESKNLEFKVARPEKNIKYMKSVIAFANGKGGKIVFGIDDKTREVIGIPEDIVFQEIDAITNAISDSCEPIIIPDVYLQTIDEKPVIVAEIHAGRQKPYYIKSEGLENGVYIRVSGTSRLANRDMARELYYECDGRSFDSVARTDLEITDAEIQELCEQMKEVAIANSKSEFQKNSIKDLTKNILLSWGILKKAEDGKIYPTNAYVYLTGQDYFRSMIQCGVFKGTTRAVFLDKREYTGPLWEQVDEAVKFVLRNIRLGCKLDGIYRQDIYELPPDSIRELVVNAVMNCSYLQASHIQVAIYDDRLEITSPGGLLSGVTIDLMKEGYSKIRNRALANAFVYMNLVEAWGSGIPKLMKAMKEYGLKDPEFIDMDVAFRINLYRGQDDLNDTNDSVYDPNDLNNSLNDPKIGPNDLNSEPNNPNNHESMVNKSNHETQLLTLIREEPELTYKQIGERLAISVSTVKRIITKLQKDGTVIRKGSKRKGKWLIQELQTKQ